MHHKTPSLHSIHTLNLFLDECIDKICQAWNDALGSVNDMIPAEDFQALANCSKRIIYGFIVSFRCIYFPGIMESILDVQALLDDASKSISDALYVDLSNALMKADRDVKALIQCMDTNHKTLMQQLRYYAEHSRKVTLLLKQLEEENRVLKAKSVPTRIQFVCSVCNKEKAYIRVPSSGVCVQCSRRK